MTWSPSVQAESDLEKESRAKAVLAQRDGTLLAQQEASSEPQSEAGSEREVRVGPIVFDQDPNGPDFLGKGHFGFVFRCDNTETGEQQAVKRMEKLRFEAEGGKK